MRDTVEAAARARQRNNIAVSGPEHLQVNVKRAGLRRCLTNLVDNALKHGAQVAVSLKQDERLVEIAVEDNGPGIPEQRREEAFRPSIAWTKAAICKLAAAAWGWPSPRDIARIHGGDILLDKSAMGGLKATIRLPV